MQQKTPVLRGRSSELTVFSDALAGFRAGRNPLVVLTGPTGIGKRRVLSEFIALAEAEGFHTEWSGRTPDPTGTDAPATDGTAAPGPDSTGAFTPDSTGARTSDDTGAPASHDPGAPTPAGTGTPAAPAGDGSPTPADNGSPTPDGASALTTSHATPTLVVLEDIQPWEQFLLLVLAAERNRPRPPLCILVPASDSSGTGTRSMARMCGFDLAEIQLGPLDDDALLALAADLLGADPDPDLADLLKQTGGVPSLAVELMRGLQEEGRVEITGTRATLTRAGLPKRLILACANALKPLPAPAQSLLHVAASQPDGCTVEHLVRSFGTMPVAVRPLIDEVVRAGVVRQDHEGRIAFTNVLLQQALRECDTESAGPAALPTEQQPESAQILHLLTAKQTLVASMVAQGLTNQQVARRLGVSPHTVSYHLNKIFSTLNISSRTQLSRVFPRDAYTNTPGEPSSLLPRIRKGA
ncbi:LuxR C-terminal-related transcriptional regulator [Streptomyces sp. NPDC087294]|uniref:LuxR C-terminal-related transcriptional regulator n=1 Tax=Streptomyces sp. NPDC087294 TaxID=3365777 RepID=UPI00380B1F44